MEPTNNQINQQPIQNEPHSVEEEKPSYTVNNVIAVIFIIVILIGWFWPVEDRIYSYNENTMPNIVRYLIIIMGGVAGISFLVRVDKLTRNVKPILRMFAILVGIGGGIFIFLIGVISSIISEFRAHPT